MDLRNPRYHATHGIQQTLDILLLSSSSLSDIDLKDLIKVVLSCLRQFLVNETLVIIHIWRQPKNQEIWPPLPCCQEKKTGFAQQYKRNQNLI